MVLGPFPPGVVGHLVIVPHRHEGVLPVDLLQVRVALVLGVTSTIVLEGDDLVARHARAAYRSARAVFALGVLVDVVAQVDDEVQIGALRDARVDVEEAEGIVRARHHRGAEPLGGARDGARAPHAGRLLERAKAVIVRGAGLEVAHVHLEREVGSQARRRPGRSRSRRRARRRSPPPSPPSRCVASSRGVTRVQITTASVSGSPLATPCRKTGSAAEVDSPSPQAGSSGPNAREPLAVRNWRRVLIVVSSRSPESKLAMKVSRPARGAPTSAADPLRNPAR